MPITETALLSGDMSQLSGPMAVAELSAMYAVEIVPTLRKSSVHAADERFLVSQLRKAQRAAQHRRGIIRHAGFESQVCLRQGSSTG